MRSIVLAPLALACGIAAAQAQSVYRCGDSYSEKPCPGGRPVATETSEPTAQERKQATGAAQRDAKLAGELEKERLKQEARPAQLYIPPPRFEPATEQSTLWPEKKATRKLDVFTASAPGGKPAKKDAKAKPKAGGKAEAQAAPTPKAPQGALPTPR